MVWLVYTAQVGGYEPFYLAVSASTYPTLEKARHTCDWLPNVDVYDSLDWVVTPDPILEGQLRIMLQDDNARPERGFEMPGWWHPPVAHRDREKQLCFLQ
jgi:hypothetical protein